MIEFGDCRETMRLMGSGTTAAVAIASGRNYLGCELNPAYKELQDLRIKEALNETAQMELI